MFGALLTACKDSSLDARVARLSARVDSLAVAVTVMKDILQSGSASAEVPDTSTVGSVGAAALGPAMAPVTVVEFTDYQCPFCARHARETLPRLRQEYVARGKVRYVIRDLPLPIHGQAINAAKAARCAGSQGEPKYWRVHDDLFTLQASLADSAFPGIARKAGLDSVRFSECMQSKAPAAAIQRDMHEADKAGLRETPSFVIGPSSPDGRVTGVVLRGAQPYDQFKFAIDRALRAGSREPPNQLNSEGG